MMRSIKHLVWLFFLVESVISYKIETDKDAVAYLTNYGYVDPEEMPLGFSLKDCNKKLKEFQKLAKVEVTGNLDTETLKAMNKPRCGCPDFIQFSLKNENSKRHDNRHHHHRHHHNHHNHASWPRSSYFGKDYHIPEHKNDTTTTFPRPEKYTLTELKWWKETISYDIVEYPSRYNMKISSNDIEKAIHQAFKIWEEHINLEFLYDPNGVEVDIEVRFVSINHGDSYPFDGPGNTLAHAFFPGTGLGGDVHFEQEEDWTRDTYNGIDLLYVAVHEIGHSLGLGHSSDFGSIMYPMYRGYIPNLQLHWDDITGIQALYGRRSRPTKPTTTIKPTKTPTSSTRRPTLRTTPRPSHGEIPDICELDDKRIDGITIMLGDAILVFTGQYVYEVGRGGEGTLSGWPKKISDYFRGLEGDIDASMTRSNGKTYFFKGTKYWRFTGTRMDRGYPRLISAYFPGIPTNVDAAFEWDEEFVFVKGMNFWRFNTKRRPQVQNFFPMPLSHWGLSKPLDAAFTDSNGTVYFFQENIFWEFDKNSHRIKNEKFGPALTSERWFGCLEEP